jgi:hypothetical protein
MAFDLDEELRRAIAVAESLYGRRDMSCQLMLVAHHQKNFPKILLALAVVPSASDSPIRGSFLDPDLEAKHELWHDAVHCLTPVNRMDTLWFEEGVALRFDLKHSPVTVHQRTKYRKQ